MKNFHEIDRFFCFHIHSKGTLISFLYELINLMDFGEFKENNLYFIMYFIN